MCVACDKEVGNGDHIRKDADGEYKVPKHKRGAQTEHEKRKEEWVEAQRYRLKKFKSE